MSENQKTYEPTQEIRIASVMFGGVSLAVYMNGITQELRRAVRATAPASPAGRGSAEPRTAHWKSQRHLEQLYDDRELDGMEMVYRTLGRTLFHGREPGAPLSHTGPIRTRIVIDLLAGTSAGGINSVYLAKALVNNQDLEELKRMWMSEADIDTLLNDSNSKQGTFPAAPPTTSLLNSTRMYGLLRQAFDDMDKQKVGTPLAEEVDLFVTTTDLDGVATPIQLADRVIDERVHKASFHFVYGPGRPGSPNDFTKQYNPMLAFAARCTSSFPVAFEPMKVEHVDRLIPGFSLDLQKPDHYLRKFFTQFERNSPGISFAKRPLADGGYLNNKPFSFVVDQIKLRTGALPVSRKLLFLDPFPELNSQVRHTKQDIDFVENALDAASILPGYQTIREDIERLNEYNRSLHAAQMLAREIEAESSDVVRDCVNPAVKHPYYPQRTLKDLEQQFGRCYRTYHRLRVSAVTAELASLVTRLIGQDDCSDSALAIRMLIHAWREEKFAPDGQNGKQLETTFLTRYDIGFRFRRADYVRGRIDDLLSALGAVNDPSAFRPFLTALPEDAQQTGAALLRSDKDEAVRELYRLRDQIEFVKWKLASETERMGIGSTRSGLDSQTDRRRGALMAALFNTGLTPEDLTWILTPVQDDQCQKRADDLYHTGVRMAYDKAPAALYATSRPRPVALHIAEAAQLLGEWYAEILDGLSEGFVEALDRKGKPDFKSAVDLIREYVWVHYQYFDCRDMQVFTVMQDQLTGEGSPVEIYRVSPLDAIQLRTNADPDGQDKLAGTALFAFGAFLSKAWRRNDMMWGRLDGAERIIGALLPNESDGCLRRQLCERAFRIIIEEEFTPSKCSDLIRPLLEYLRHTIKTEGKSADQFLKEATSDSEKNCPEVIRQLLKSVASDSDRLAVFRAYYLKPAVPEIDQSLDRMRRALRIFGRMLKELDGGDGPFTTIGGTIANLGAALTRFAEFCIPQRLPSVFFRYALQLLYAIAIVLVITGAFFYKEVETAGWVILGLTAAANVMAWVVIKWLLRARTGRWIAGMALLVVVLAAALGTLLLHFQCPHDSWKKPIYSIVHRNESGCGAQIR